LPTAFAELGFDRLSLRRVDDNRFATLGGVQQYGIVIRKAGNLNNGGAWHAEQSQRV